MTSKERIESAFAGETSDRTPIHHIGVSSSVASALLEREAYVGGGIQQWREATALWSGKEAHQEFVERSFQDAIAISKLIGNDLVRASYWRHPIKPTCKVDENTFLYEYGEEKEWLILRYDPPSEQCSIMPYMGKIERTIEDIERALEGRETNLADYQPLPPAFELRALEEYGEELAIRAGGGWIQIPVEETSIWLEAMAVRPDLVERHLDLQVIEAGKYIPTLAKQGLRYIFGGGDFASNDGPMYSPEMFRKFIIPRIKQVVDICHQNGCYYLFGSDGNLWPVADDLFGRNGVDGYYEIDKRAGMNLQQLHTHFPELVLVGNIASHTLHFGTLDDILREVEEAMEESKNSSRTIVGTSNYFVPGTPTENIVFMLETIEKMQ